MISIREEIAIAAPPEAVWPLLSDPAVVASCIPGAALTKADDKGGYQGTMRVKFGPTVAQFRGEAKLTYDHAARRCSIEGRGIDATLLRVEGNFHVTGPLETFANAGGVHLARALLAEFAANVAKLMAAPDGDAELPGEAAALSGGKILSRAAASWMRDKFSGKETK